MSRNGKSKKTGKTQTESGITKITVCGFKSINREQSIEIRPLTILAGANSSGKSSIMQPLLLLKQTLEATYDPGPLLLNGPNVKFTSVEQMFSLTGTKKSNNIIMVEIASDHPEVLTLNFDRQPRGGIRIKQMAIANELGKVKLKPGIATNEILFSSPIKKARELIEKEHNQSGNYTWKVISERCFLGLEHSSERDKGTYRFSPLVHTDFDITEMIHLPGSRGNAERAYSVTAVGSTFTGTFEIYTASIIANWQAEKENEKLAKLSKDLERLGLTWKVTAKQINDAQVEIQVGRLPRAAKGGARDLVNIADVGFGVSQTLPVLVALLVAEPGQLVYIEEPEIHLHPRAQTALAQILADAAIRGVRVVIETHSQLLLLGIQTLVAEGKLAPDLVKLHWFTRNDNGTTEINSADLNETGAFGDWPEDFAETSLKAESRYLDAAETQLLIN